MTRVESLTVHPDEFSRTVLVSEIGRDGLKLSISADKNECNSLALRFGLAEIKRLEAEIYVARRPSSDEKIYVDVHFSTDLVQNCVASLRPIETNIIDRFSVVFASGQERASSSESFTIEDLDPPDLFSEGRLEVGGLLAEHLALALDPYPRHPDSALPEFEESGARGVTGTREPLEKPLKDLRKLLKKRKLFKK